MSSHSRHAQAFVSIPVSVSKSARLKLVSTAYSKFLHSDRHKQPITNNSFGLFYCSFALWKWFYLVKMVLFVFWKTCCFLNIIYFSLYFFVCVCVSWAFFCALRLCTGSTTRRGSRGIALLFLDHGTRSGWGVNVMPRPHFTPGKDPVPILQEAGWAPGLVWTDAEKLTPPGFDTRIVQPVASRYTKYTTRPASSVQLLLSIYHCVMLVWRTKMR